MSPVGRLSIVLGLLAVLPVGAAASDGANGAAAPRPPQATFRSGVDVVALNVTVHDNQRQLLAGLGRQDFAVFEDGVRQEIAYFEASDVPLDLAILLDSSVSMSDKLPFVQKAAAGFAATLGPADRAAVFAFNDRVQMLQGFTSDAGVLQRAIADTKASGGTALYNAIYVALREFQKESRADDRVRRRAIVVLSDGEDTASLLTFDELMGEVRRAGVTIYTIGLHIESEGRQAVRAARRYFSQADYTLKALAQETGANVFFPGRQGDLAEAYATIGRELAGQYAIGYVSRNPMRNGAFRRVVVRVEGRPDARPRTRSGYLASAITQVAQR
jgi:Ca-activated chloride channel family protein